MDPINFGTPINSEFDEISPTMTLEGFGIYFSSNRKSRNFADFYVYSSTSREVVKKFDYEALVRLLITVAVIVVLLLLLYFLIKTLLRDTRMKTLTKCFLAAIVCLGILPAVTNAQDYWAINSSSLNISNAAGSDVLKV